MQASCDSQDQVLSFRCIVRRSVVVDVNSKVDISAGMKSTCIPINFCVWFQQSLEPCASSHLEAKGLFFARTLVGVKCKCGGGGGELPGSPNANPISDQNMPFSKSVFRPGVAISVSCLIKVTELNFNELLLLANLIWQTF